MNKRMTMLGLLTAVLILTEGCKSPPDVVAYKGLNTIAVTVDAARQSWVSYVNQQRAILPADSKERQELEINVGKGATVYGQYQQAMRVAVKAVRSYKDLPADTTGLNAAIAVLSATAGDFVAFVNSLINPAKTLK